MKQILVFLLLLTFFKASSQSDVTKVFEIPANAYDLGTRVLPNGEGYAVFGYGGRPSSSNVDIFLLQLDKDGNEIGRHFYGLPNKTEKIAKGVVPVGNDGWLLAGGQVVSAGGGTQGYLVRVGAGGNVIWSKNLTNPNLSGFSVYALASLPSGGFLAAGEDTYDLEVVRLAENGDVVWYKSYGTGRAEALYISESGGNCFLISSHTVLKIRTSDGQLMWKRDIELPVFGAPNGDISVTLDDIVPVGNGRFAICGTALNDEIFSYVQAPYASLWKENGEILWSKAFPSNTGNGEETGNSLLYLPNQQNLLLTGEGAKGINVTRIDMNGNTLAINSIHTPALCINPVLLKHQGKYIATGGCFTGGMNTLFYRSAGNALPLGDLRAGDRAVDPSPDFSISPNPATTTIKLDYWSEARSEVCFQMVNAAGQLIFEKNTNACMGENAETFNVQTLPTGLYWLIAPQIGMPPIAWLKE